MTKKIKDADFSKLTKSRLKKAATRVNSMQPITHLEYKSLKGAPELRGKEPWKPRKRLPNEAPGQVDDLWQRPVYRTGDGDIPVPPRPGSLDFLKWPSKGYRT